MAKGRKNRQLKGKPAETKIQKPNPRNIVDADIKQVPASQVLLRSKKTGKNANVRFPDGEDTLKN